MKILFRHCAELLEEAMHTLKEFNSLDELVVYLKVFCKENYIDTSKRFYIKLYNLIDGVPFNLGKDDRIGWSNTFLVGFDDFGPIGWMCIQ